MDIDRALDLLYNEPSPINSTDSNLLEVRHDQYYDVYTFKDGTEYRYNVGD